MAWYTRFSFLLDTLEVIFGDDLASQSRDWWCKNGVLTKSNFNQVTTQKTYTTKLNAPTQMKLKVYSLFNPFNATDETKGLLTV